MILDKILAHKKLEVDIQKEHTPLGAIERRLTDVAPVRGFREAISSPGRVDLIAEIKKASPSRGVIRTDFDPQAIARTYEENGAAAKVTDLVKGIWRGSGAVFERPEDLAQCIDISHRVEHAAIQAEEATLQQQIAVAEAKAEARKLAEARKGT